MQAGILRRVTVPRRGGVGAAAVGEGVASVDEWQALVRAHVELSDDVKGTKMPSVRLEVCMADAAYRKVRFQYGG